MLKVVVDRGDVGRGDDVPHGQVWEFDDDATIGAVLLRLFEQRFLASIAGRNSWVMQLMSGAEVSYEYNGQPEIGLSADHERRCCHIMFGYMGERDQDTFSFLSAGGPRTPIRAALEPSPTGEYVFYFDYLSGGGMIPFDHFASVVAEERRKMDTEDAALRARFFASLMARMPSAYVKDGKLRLRQ